MSDLLIRGVEMPKDKSVDGYKIITDELVVIEAEEGET